MSRDRTPAEPDAERLQALIDGWAKEGLLLPGERSRTPTERPFGIDPAGTAGRRDRTEPGDLADLALLAHALERALPMTAPAPFKADLQARLQDLMQERPRRRRASALLRLAPKLAAAAAAIVLAFGSAVVVSADSLPGQALYPVKRAVEDTRLALTLDPAARARLRLDMAVSRADELEGLLASGAPFGAEVIEDLIAAREAALAAATEVNDTTLSARIDASSDEVDALVEQAYLRLPEAGEAQPAPTSRALSGPNGTATGILVTADAATPRSTLDAGEPGGGEGADEPPRPVAPGSGSAPVRPARFASPTPGTSEVGPPTRPLGPPTSGAPTGIATAVPATARPTDPPTNEPTLDRGAQREATVRAGTHVAPEESAGAATSEAAPTSAHPPGS